MGCLAPAGTLRSWANAQELLNKSHDGSKEFRCSARTFKVVAMIAVHVGAGFHAQSKIPAYKQACQSACASALDLLREGGSALHAASLAVSLLENSPITNAGIGSNLTEKGVVECDACLMDDEANFGACGAVQGVKNPVKLAEIILENQKKPRVMGRVHPCVLVGPGAGEWAKSHGVELCDPDDLKTPASSHSYNKYMGYLKSSENGHSRVELPVEEVTDTVGAVCVDSGGRMAAAASSGGLLLKPPGRVGPAAMFGCGCWAETRQNRGLAVTASGCGEQLMQTMLVRETARNVFNQDSDTSSAVQESIAKFLSCQQLAHERNAGLLVLFKEDDFCELIWTHSTQTMVLGYGGVGSEKPVSLVSRNSGKPGRSNVLSGVRTVFKS